MTITINDPVLIFPNDDPKTVTVKDKILPFNYSFSETIKHIDSSKIVAIYWRWQGENKIGWYADVLYGSDYRETPLTDDDWETCIKPFVDQWQTEKDRLEQEEAEAEAEWNKFENRQARALTQLNADFETVKERAHIKSSLGFTIDANSTAKENVQGLIEEVGTGTVQFCDCYNQFHELSKTQLETLKSEINKNGQALYAQKWQYRVSIEQCTDNDSLDQVLAGIEFTYMDFTPTDEQA